MLPYLQYSIQRLFSNSWHSTIARKVSKGSLPVSESIQHSFKDHSSKAKERNNTQEHVDRREQLTGISSGSNLSIAYRRQRYSRKVDGIDDPQSFDRMVKNNSYSI